MPVKPSTTGRFVHADQGAAGGIFRDEACDTQERRMHMVFANAGDMGVALRAPRAVTVGFDRQQEGHEVRVLIWSVITGVDERAILDPGIKQSTDL